MLRHLGRVVVVFVTLLVVSTNTGFTKEPVKKLTFSTIHQKISMILDSTHAILEEAYKRLGIEISYQKLPTKRALLMANSGDFDGELGRVKGISKKFPNLIMVPTPVFAYKLYVASRKKIDLSKGLDAHKDKVICSALGLPILQRMTANFKHVAKLKTAALGPEGIVKNRCEIAITTTEYYKDFIQENREHKDALVLNEPPVLSIEIYHYLHKKNKDLVPKLTRTLKVMFVTGKTKEIAKEVFRTNDYN